MAELRTINEIINKIKNEDNLFVNIPTDDPHHTQSAFYDFIKE